MSFDLFYMSSQPMTADEVSAVQTLLDEAKTTGPDEYGCYVVEFQDGGGAEVFASNLSEGFMVSVGGFSPTFLDFLFQLLKAGNLLMCPAMEDAVTVGASESSFEEAPDDLPQRVVCNSPGELGILLSKGFDGWKRYRDQVVGE